MNYLLNYNMNSICLALDADFWTDIVGNLISGIFTLLGIAIAACLAYKYAIKQKKKEIFVALEKTKYERKLKALEHCWQLLAFTTDTENPKAILLWEKNNDGGKNYFVQKVNAETFLSALPDFFYQSGLGIYLSTDIKEKLFEYRGIIYGFLLKTKEEKENSIPVMKIKMAEKMIKLHQSLVILVKEETSQIEGLEIKN